MWVVWSPSIGASPYPVLFDPNGVITAYDYRESLLVTTDYLFYATSMAEQFYAFLSPDNGGTEGGAKTIEAIFEMGCGLS